MPWLHHGLMLDFARAETILLAQYAEPNAENLMKKLMTMSVASLMMISAVVPITTPARADHDHHHHNGAGVAAGVFLGLTAAAIIANSSHANAEEHHRWRERCEHWAHRCNRGDDDACYAFHDRCER